MPQGLPKSFHQYFWDISTQKIVLAKHDTFVIERILEWGDITGLKWLLQYFGREKVETVIQHTRNLSKRTANLYSYLFSIPRKDIKCLGKHSFQTLPWSLRN